jgi:ribosome maturation factor RimP
LSLSESQLEQVRRLAEEVALREGCRLYDLEFAGGPNRTLRIYIEREAKEGVSVEDCANVSRGINLMLDVEDPIPGGRYQLEVSSPGMERKLTQLWHFEKALGMNVRVSMKQRDPSEPPATVPSFIEGMVKAVAGEKITIENKKGTFDVEYNYIQKAKQVFTAPEKGKKR